MEIFDEKKTLRKKLEHHIDAECCQESISGNQKCSGAIFWTLERNFTFFGKNYFFFVLIVPQSIAISEIFCTILHALVLYLHNVNIVVIQIEHCTAATARQHPLIMMPSGALIAIEVICRNQNSIHVLVWTVYNYIIGIFQSPTGGIQAV